MYDEGVIKFQAVHEERPLEPRRYGALACELIAWREIMARTQLVGQDPARYGGAGYGNVSARVGPFPGSRGERPFLVTGTQTSGNACMRLADFCVARSYNYHQNQVHSYGPILPSSEAMTHGAIYDLAPNIRYVLHAHTPVIWRRARELRIPTTDSAVPYGTPEMALEVHRLFRSTPLAEVRILCMGGHEDGVIVFGTTAEAAGQVMLAVLARAYERQCGEQDVSLCTR